MDGPGARRGCTGPTVGAMSAGVLSVGTPHGGGATVGVGGGITLAMAEAIIRHTAAGQLDPRGVMSCLQETVVGVPPLNQGLHGRSEPRIWYWIWRDERAERPWTVAPGQWSLSVISPARGSAASSGQVVIH